VFWRSRPASVLTIVKGAVRENVILPLNTVHPNGRLRLAKVDLMRGKKRLLTAGKWPQMLSNSGLGATARHNGSIMGARQAVPRLPPTGGALRPSKTWPLPESGRRPLLGQAVRVWYVSRRCGTRPVRKPTEAG
jgi:hypothetical protein